MSNSQLPVSLPKIISVSFYLSLVFAVLTDAVTHERNLIWSQKEDGTGAARLVGVRGDPYRWVGSRSAATRYITAPNPRWRFTALAYDFRRAIVYWSDTGNKKIQGLQLNGSQSAFSVFEGSSSQVNGMTVDWVTGNVYWTDSLYNWIVVSAGGRNRAMYSIIIDTDLDRPSGIAVSPHNGLLFWADWGNTPKIERCTCAGDSRHILVTDDVIKPLGMTLDHSNNALYWVDGAKGSVDTCDIYGQNRKTLFRVEHASFFGIALFKNYVFVTEQNERQLYVFDIKKSRHEVKFSTSARPYDVIMYDEITQEEMSNPCERAGCAHLCVPVGRDTHQCLCAVGYSLQQDKKACTANGHFGSPQFVYSIGSALCRFPGNMADMSLTNVSLDSQCFLTHRKAALALSADVHKDILFFAENKTRTISMLRLREGASPEVIVGGTGSVEGLALDWVSSNLYWTDAIFKQVMVARSDGRFQKQLVSSNLEKPRGIAVDPLNRHLYWTDVGQKPKIERSGLDGRARSEFVSADLGSPNHVVVDYKTASLCWSDSVRDRLECIGLDGAGRRVVVSQPGTDMYGLTVFQDYVAWTDQHTRNGLHTAIRDTGQKVRGIVHPGIGNAYDVITYDKSLQPLVSGPCGEQNGGCEHLCLAVLSSGPTNYVCFCAMGFVKGSNGRTCMADAYYDNFVLFTDTYHKQIYQMALGSGAFHAVPLEDHANPIAVDYDPLHRRVYWTDVAEKVIKCAFLNGSRETVVRHFEKKSVPDGLAVEPISRLAYYTDAGVKVIGAVTMDTGYNHVIIKDKLDQPRAIVLDPGRGHMYWTDWGLHSRIEKARMDGSFRKRLVNTGLGAWPNGLAIDPKSERLFWCDARADRIETCDLEGADRRVLYRDTESHFFGIATLAGTVFYTDWTKKSIMQIDTLVDKAVPKALGPTLFARINDIHIYKSNYLEKRYLDNACGYRNGGCSHLCLPIPSGRTCACPTGMTLVNGYRCIVGSDVNETPTSIYTTTQRTTYGVISSPKPAHHRTSPLPPTTTTTTTTTPSTTSSPPTTSTTTPTTTSTTPSPTTTTITSATTTASTTLPTTTTTSPTTPSPTTATTSQGTRYPSRELPVDVATPDSTSYNVEYGIHDGIDGLVIDRFTLPNPSSTQTPVHSHPGDTDVEDPGGGGKDPGGGGGGVGTTSGGVDVTKAPGRAASTTDSSPPHYSKPTDKLEDFEFSMFALLAIIIGGIVMMCLIVASGIVLYKKMDPTAPRRRREEPPLSTLSDIYEMPDKERESPPAAARYGYLHEGYYNGDLDSSMEGEFSSRDNINTYEEIVENSEGQDRAHFSFSTFR